MKILALMGAIVIGGIGMALSNMASQVAEAGMRLN
jgi:hypothetical protein